MRARPAMNAADITALLEDWLEADVSFHPVETLAGALAAMPAGERDFLLDLIERLARTHVELGWQFGRRAPGLLAGLGRRQMAAWALAACDAYDREGLRPALRAVERGHAFAQSQRDARAGVLYEDVAGVLGHFVRGLSGRGLALARGDGLYTDTERLYLPALFARFPDEADNFRLAKAASALLWAQTRFGTWRADLAAACAAFTDPARALRQLNALETLRLTACIGRELPGLRRDMARLSAQLGETLPAAWDGFAQALARPEAGAAASIEWLPAAYALPELAPRCYQGELRPEAVAAAFAARRDKDKARLKLKLAALMRDPPAGGKPERPAGGHRFEARLDAAAGRLDLTLTLDGLPLAPPEDVRGLITSVWLDFGAIPPEYLVPAGPGEYDPALIRDLPPDPDAVWQGTYHEAGASLYPEWDLGRRHYRKDWCVMREKAVAPVHDGFARATLDKYAGLARRLRRAFEAMRDEDRLLKRQAHGDEVDIDALVAALAEARAGGEQSERLYLRRHRAERNIAVSFMVDMSGSTRGWINQAEREALILLCEALERLGDRYAIHGFSGITRKRCELYRVKAFDEPYTETVRARISGIRPQEYTRMGFAIRHLTKLLQGVEARTRVLITLSDGRPDDYFDGYRGAYGIEDTRMALIEARRAGIHPFCITLDREARDYLPHMYGPARYIILDDVRDLPVKAADIYRRLTG